MFTWSRSAAECAGVFLGGKEAAQDKEGLKKLGVTHVLTGERLSL
jgi:hypothetical protein